MSDESVSNSTEGAEGLTVPTRSPPLSFRSPSFDETALSDQRRKSSMTPLFFADVKLDLEEAHDIAETPEAAKPVFSTSVTSSRHLELPSLSGVDEETTTTPVSSSPHNNRSMTRITHMETDWRRASLPTTLPRWPRDMVWAVSFMLVCPLALVWPILLVRHNDETVSPLAKHPLSTATLHALFWAAAATVVLTRLYRTPGGGDGEDARATMAAALVTAAPASAVVYGMLSVATFFSLPDARWWATIIPLWCTVRDLLLFRTWKDSQTGGSSGASSSSVSSKYAFFQALVVMVLDILSRSLRRASFFRVLTGLLVVQMGLLYLWRAALLGALSAHSTWLTILALVGGKWATGTVARQLSLMASGGVLSWFVQQAVRMEQASENAPPTATRSSGNPEPAATPDPNERAIPEAYRTVDASVYESVVNMDDVLDDDDPEDDEDDGDTEAQAMLSSTPHRHRSGRVVPPPPPLHTRSVPKSTVKSILGAGLTVSFGSVAQCGLLGGLAQFVWSQVRKAQAAERAWNRRYYASRAGRRPQPPSNSSSLWLKLVGRLDAVARGFVRNHSDLAMSHVAAYHKTYQRAARDVALLVDESGVEPILDDDIATHICSCIGGSISGIIVLFAGHVLLHQRKKMDISDTQVVVDMLMAFLLSYTLIFTVMEPLRAGIKAVYVAFCQYPQSLSQAFPLIFHRLSRLAESNVS